MDYRNKPKLQCAHMVKYYSAIKKGVLLMDPLEGSHRHSAKEEEPGLKSHMPQNAIYRTFLRRKLQSLEIRSMVASIWGDRRGVGNKGATQRDFQGDETVLYPDDGRGY